jgi:hypothetical protein
LNRTKEEAEGTAAHRHRCRACFGSFDTQEGIKSTLRGHQIHSKRAKNETTPTFDLTHKRDKSNIIYQKLIKKRHPGKIKSTFSNI